MPVAFLSERKLLSVTGETAEDFLQALVTADVAGIGAGEARPAALLTPQGKILFDFLVSRTEGGFVLDVAATARGDLAKRLALYRLRAKIAITPLEEDVFAVFEAAALPEGALVDTRFPGAAVGRLYGTGVANAPVVDFEALRIRAGVAEAETDFPAADVFPHDVLLDQNGGVSFRKGCYVGQEVVSRMQHRGTARRRLVLVEADGQLTPGAPVLAGTASIGTVLAATGAQGFALVRIDKLAAALAGGTVLVVVGVPVEATIPSWAGYTLPEATVAEEIEP